jgi:predicted cupin superfamily sugar epimerase
MLTRHFTDFFPRFFLTFVAAQVDSEMGLLWKRKQTIWTRGYHLLQPKSCTTKWPKTSAEEVVHKHSGAMVEEHCNDTIKV